ncbi:hypothetical protein HQ563_17915 [bacterium]|nr:hypothetical protein [bacterium]
MLSRNVKYLLPGLLFVAFCGIFGCGGGGGGGNPLPPVTDITGTWEGEAKDPGVTGNYWYPIEFTIRQNGNTVTGISSLPGLAQFKGKIDGNVLTIEGTDIYAYITSDGSGGKEIRGSFTSSGIPGGGAADGMAATAGGGQTAVFYLRRITEFGIL